MKDAYPLVWSGRFHTLRVARNWRSFWSLTGSCDFLATSHAVYLPAGGALVLCGTYSVVRVARAHFSEHDRWWAWSRKLCDDFADCFVSRRPRVGNDFWDITGTYFTPERVAMVSASRASGFVGPDNWTTGG